MKATLRGLSEWSQVLQGEKPVIYRKAEGHEEKKERG